MVWLGILTITLIVGFLAWPLGDDDFQRKHDEDTGLLLFGSWALWEE